MKVSKCTSMEDSYVVTNDGLGMLFDSVIFSSETYIELSYMGDPRGGVFKPGIVPFLERCDELSINVIDKRTKTA